MGLGTLLLGADRKTYIGVVKVNVMLNETIDISSKATEFPVELGYNITDHIIINPTTINATFYVSDYSLFSGAGILSGASTTYRLLKIQHDLGIPLTYINDLDIFPLCHLEKISVPRNSETGRGLEFTVQLKEIKIVLPLGVLFPDSMLGGSGAVVAQVASTVVT